MNPLKIEKNGVGADTVEAVAACIWAGMGSCGYVLGGADFPDIHEQAKADLRMIARDVIATMHGGRNGP